MIDANILAKFIEPVRNRIMNMIGRGITITVDDSGDRQKIKISLLKDEVHDKMERFQNYGLTSNPPPGSTALAVFQGGIREDGVVVAIENRKFRLKGLASGEVALYTDEGDKIHFKRGNKIEIQTKELTINSNSKVTVNSDNVDIVTKTAKISSTTSTIIASEAVNVTAPALNVSGLIQCAGLGAGGPAEAGKVKVVGSMTVTDSISSGGNVSDSSGSMSDMRTKYNSHKHNVSDPTPNPIM